MKTDVIFDVDTGSDDALMLIYAIRSGIIPKAIIASYGNADIDNTTKNTLGILNFLNHENISVVRGLSKPYKINSVNKGLDGKKYHGDNGLYEIKLNYNYKKFIASGLNSNDVLEILGFDSDDKNIFRKYIWIVSGPCTNFSYLIKNIPNFKNLIDKVFILGGSLDGKGNESKTSEFNFMLDAESVDGVLKSGMEIYLVPTEVTNGLRVSREMIGKIRANSPIGEFALTIISKYFALPHSKDYFQLYDPALVGVFKNYIKFRKRKIMISTNVKNYGQITTGNNSGYDISCAYEINNSLFMDDFFKVLGLLSQSY